jgi:hypothetical protein
MKKIFMIIVAVVAVLSAAQSFACHINFTPDSIKHAQVGDIVKIEAVVVKEHRNCQLADTDVHVEVSDNIKVLSETGWATVGKNEIHNTFEIEVLNAGEVAFRVFRECSKKGVSEGILTFDVVN